MKIRPSNTHYENVMKDALTVCDDGDKTWYAWTLHNTLTCIQLSGPPCTVNGGGCIKQYAPSAMTIYMYITWAHCQRRGYTLYSTAAAWVDIMCTKIFTLKKVPLCAINTVISNRKSFIFLITAKS